MFRHVGAEEPLFFHPGEVCLKDAQMIGLLRWMKASLEALEHTSMLAGRYYLDPVFPILLKVNENLMMNVLNRTSSHISFKNHMHHGDHNVVNTAEEQLEQYIGGGPPFTVSPEDSQMFRYNDGIDLLDWIEGKLLERNMEDVIEGNPIPFILLGTITAVCRDARKAFVEKQSFTLSIDYRYEARSTAGPHLVRAHVQVDDDAIPVIVLE